MSKAFACREEYRSDSSAMSSDCTLEVGAPKLCDCSNSRLRARFKRMVRQGSGEPHAACAPHRSEFSARGDDLLRGVLRLGELAQKKSRGAR